MGASQSSPNGKVSVAEQKIADMIDEIILEHDVVIFGKLLCGATLDAKVYIEKGGKDVVGFEKAHNINLDAKPRDGRIIEKVLVKRTGKISSPWVFIGAQFRGGDRDLYMYTAGETLAILIDKAPEHRKIRREQLESAKKAATHENDNSEAPGPSRTKRKLVL